MPSVKNKGKMQKGQFHVVTRVELYLGREGRGMGREREATLDWMVRGLLEKVTFGLKPA